ncbi:hypothetical protein D3C72_1667260 [compost metagenome]
MPASNVVLAGKVHLNVPDANVKTTSLAEKSPGSKIASTSCTPVCAVVFAVTSCAAEAPLNIPVAKSNVAAVFTLLYTTCSPFTSVKPFPGLTVNSTLLSL